MNRFCCTLGFTAALVWVLGCSSSQPAGPQVAQVKGTVTMDGKAIPTGEIHFGMPGTPPRPLTIKDGAFAGDAPVGKNQVEVFVYTEKGAIAGKHGGEGSKTNTVPQKYWGPKTTLEATVSAGGGNDFNFPLTSK